MQFINVGLFEMARHILQKNSKTLTNHLGANHTESSSKGEKNFISSADGLLGAILWGIISVLAGAMALYALGYYLGNNIHSGTSPDYREYNTMGDYSGRNVAISEPE